MISSSSYQVQYMYFVCLSPPFRGLLPLPPPRSIDNQSSARRVNNRVKFRGEIRSPAGIPQQHHHHPPVKKASQVRSGHHRIPAVVQFLALALAVTNPKGGGGMMPPAASAAPARYGRPVCTVPPCEAVSPCIHHASRHRPAGG